ncbi:MAG: DUF3857 domain-containing protein [Candidatus Pedobacter colombiensis]|uniref:DUF3857 domain-containing protein n=1 Tax=Candidatus Pedobacter colombiensis TaxID=3121371 RepID=A0AAJ5WA32_9SPHI|nr:DUF3857 domain-containing protein [Pedobacter sp.]WEK20796.1 MAG: DUF3857 domain-containing protein [Pedobacter sp.]
MKKSILFIAVLFTFARVTAQGIYDVSKIPPGLTNNASVVIRNEELIYEVKAPGTAIQTYKTAMTILNKNGENFSKMSEYYDKFSSISNLKASLYDEKGIKIKDYKSADFKDVSAVSDGTLYQDDRAKYLEFLHTKFPYTIEFSYTVDYSGIRNYPTWYPASTWDIAIEKSNYTFKIPETMTFKYLKSKGLNTDSLKVKDKINYKWSCENIPAAEFEALSVGLRNIMPWVNVAPNEFEYDHSKANIENWKNLGSWIFNLNNGGQVLPEAAKAKIQAMIKDAKTPQEKIKILYNYLQSNTRYVGVQLGIGGYKPITAEKVSAVNYSDCKGLSNYMKAILQEAGIKSNLVVIGNGLPSLNKNYASMNQANHMILCVPLEKDTTWLECTSQYTPAGFIGNSNSNRTVLLVTEDGGKLAQTPIYSPSSNLQHRNAKVVLDEEGSANINIETQYKNAQYEDHIGLLLMEPTDRRKRVINTLSIPNVEITTLNINQPNKNLPILNEQIELKSSQLLTKGGDKLFLTLNLLNRQESTVTPLEARKTFFSIKYGYSDEDEIIYTIPKGYKVEFIPKDIVIESEFGKYSAKVVVKDNTLVYTRTQMMVNATYPPEKYNDFVAFNKKVYQADKQKGILAKVN